jgi:TetR/AcrR family transcriptional regulator of autoinduction and epiphytic fitness
MKTAKVKTQDRQLSPEKTDAILNGAMQEFLKHGYAATSVDRIAAAAGVSKATIYNHFQDKQALFGKLAHNLVTKKFRTVFGISLDDAQLPQGEPSQILRKFAFNVLDADGEDPLFLDFMRLILGESGRFPELAQIMVETMHKSAFGYLSQYFASCPQLKSSDPEATVRVFIGTLVHFIIVQKILHGESIMPLERDRLVNTLIELIV